MKAGAHPVACSHLPLSGHMDRIKALPPSSTKTFLPPSRHMERITHRSMKTLAAVDDNNRVSPPTPAGHDKWPPMGSFEDESSGITWVGVHGMDSICVVARNEDPGVTRLCDILKRMPIHNVPFSFRKSVIVEIEDLADPSSKIRERFPKRIEKPFGVVSAIPDAYKSHKGSGHEASSVEYDETKAIEFLQEKVKSDRVFTVTETIQTAIAAFEQLFQKKFKADEIKVSLLDPNYVVYADSNGKDPSVQDLTDRQINEHLAVINKPGPKDSSSDSRRINGRSALINKPGAKDSSSDSWRLREQQRRQSTV